MNIPKTVLKQEGQSASNTKCKCKICILEIEAGHHVGFVFGIIESGFVNPRDPFVEKTKNEVLIKCQAWAKQMIPDCVFSA